MTETPPPRTMHVGRSWTGHPLEDDCPCVQVACGLVSIPGSDPICPEHGVAAFKTLRQGHFADECKGQSR